MHIHTKTEGVSDSDSSPSEKYPDRSLDYINNQFKIVFEHSNDAIFIIDPFQDKIIDCNPKASEILGFSHEELLKKRVSEIHPKEMPQLLEFAKSVYQQGHGWTNEFHCLTKQGIFKPTEISASIFAYEGHNYLLAIVRDISARKQAEEARNRLVAIIENSPDFIGFGTLDKPPKLLYINQAGLNMVGLESLNNIENFSIIDFLTDQEQSHYKKEILPKVLQQGHWEGETFFRHLKTGKSIPVHQHLFTIKDPEGQTIGVGTITRDITHLKKIQQALERAHQKLERQAEKALYRYAKRLETLQVIDRAILSARSSEEIAQAALQYIQQLIPCHRATVSVFDFQNNTGTVLATFVKNKTHVGTGLKLPIQVFGLVEELKKGKPRIVDDVFSSPQPPVIEKLKAEGIRSFLNMPILIRDELIGTLNLGSKKTKAFTQEHLEIAREVADTLAIAMYQARLNEQLRSYAEELEKRVQERTAELESFSYSVSHDLRAPLRAIDGFSRILEEEYGSRLDAEGQRLLGIIRNNTKNMGQLIDDLLVFSRLGRKELQITEIDLEKIAQDIFNELTLAETDRKITLTLKKLPKVYGDATMIRQVMINLISNAMKFTRPKKVAKIEIGVNKKASETVYYVRDNGVGFDMKYVDKIFGVFQRLHTSEEFEGTGVGLAIVQRVIHRHGGKVWAKGQINRGATIFFTLPKKEIVHASSRSS